MEPPCSPSPPRLLLLAMEVVGSEEVVAAAAPLLVRSYPLPAYARRRVNYRIRSSTDGSMQNLGIAEQMMETRRSQRSPANRARRANNGPAGTAPVRTYRCVSPRVMMMLEPPRRRSTSCGLLNNLNMRQLQWPGPDAGSMYSMCLFTFG